MDLPLLRSEWSLPEAAGASRAFEHHVAQLVRWLGVAGAEPRLCLVLSSGPSATDSFVDLLGARGFKVVRLESTPDDPVPAPIREHRGDHFNDKLYLLRAEDPEALDRLDGLRSQLQKMATWVGVLIETPAAVAALADRAPGLRRAFMRECVVADRLPAGPSVLGGTVAEQVYGALAGDREATSLAFDRLVRSGYAQLMVGRKVHPSWQKLSERWAEGAVRVEPDGSLSMIAGHVAESLGETAPTSNLATWVRARIDQRGVPAGLRVHAELAIGEACAVAEDLDGLVVALANAVKLGSAPGVAPELRFEVVETAMRLKTALGERTAARRLLDAAEVLSPTLCSPLYDARVLAARGAFTAPLDPARARVDLMQAATLFAAHGYPKWATRAEDDSP